MKVLLINPPLGEKSLPLGLGYISAVLDKNNIKNKILNLSDTRTSINLLNPILLQKFEPEIVGISTLTVSSIDALKIAEMVKKFNQNIITIVGGTHATFQPFQMLENSFIDIVVLHEGEFTLLELINKLNSNDNLSSVRGIVYRDANDKIITTPKRHFIENLDILPFPKWNDMHPRFSNRYYNEIPIQTSRGCNYNCIYCSTTKMFGSKLRLRSIQNVADELEYQKQKLKLDSFNFVDDTFTAFPKRVFNLCDEVIRRKLDISWGCLTRVDMLSISLLKKMHKSGCEIVCVGIESGVQDILNKINKKITIQQIKEAVNDIKKSRIKAKGSFIIGYPWDTKETVTRTIDFVSRLNLDIVSINILTPFPGTDLYENLTNYGITIIDNRFKNFNGYQVVIETGNLNRQNLMDLFLDAINIVCKPI